MASLSNVFQGGFDANAVEPDAGRDFAPLPAGAYEVEITGSEVKDTKNGSGCYLSLELTVIGPTGAGRKVWQNVTLKNANAQAESIGQAQLSALCRAVGIATLTDSDQLFQKILRVRLKVTPPKGDFPAKNEVSAFEAMGAPQPGPSAARPAANAAAPAAGGAKKAPWAK
jgi:hypothetical protein